VYHEKVNNSIHRYENLDRNNARKKGAVAKVDENLLEQQLIPNLAQVINWFCH